MYNFYEVEWKDRNDKLCLLLIVDTDFAAPEESFTDVLHLEPGRTPFVTETTTDNEVFTPILDSSAKLCVVNNFELTSEFDLSRSHRYHVYLQVDGTMRWRGFLSCESLSQPYKSDVDEFTLNCESYLSLLDSKYIDTTLVRDTLPNMLYNTFASASAYDIDTIALQADSRFTGMRQAKVYFPEGDQDVILTEAMTMLYSVIPYVGQEDPDDSVPVRTMLEEICRLYGWTMKQNESDIWFESQYATKYKVFEIEDLMTSELTNEDGTTSRTIAGDISTATEVTVSDSSVTLTPSGEHKINVIPGSKQIKVTSEKTTISGSLFDTLDEMVGDIDETKIEKSVYNDDDEVTRHMMGYLRAKKSKNVTFNDVVLYREKIDSLYFTTMIWPTATLATYGDSDVMADSISAEKSTDEKLSGFCSPHFAKMCFWSSTDETNMKRYDLKNCILIRQKFPQAALTQKDDSIETYEAGVGPSMTYSDYINAPLISIKSKRPVDFKDGCLVLNITYKSLGGRKIGFFWSYAQPFGLRCKVFVENRGSYNGYWRDSWWYGNANPDNSKPTQNGVWDIYKASPYQGACAYVSHIISSEPLINRYECSSQDTMILGLPYNGSSSGYILPITDRLSGYLTLDLYPLFSNGKHHYDWTAITDISVEFCSIDNKLNEDYDSNKERKEDIDGNSNDANEVTLKMHSYIDSEYSYGQLCNSDGSDVTTLTFGTTARVPEDVLFAKRKDAFSNSRNYYELTCEYDNSVGPLNPIHGSKHLVTVKSIDWRSCDAEYLYTDKLNTPTYD